MLNEFLNEKRRKILGDLLSRYPFMELEDDFISLKTDEICEKSDQINHLIEYTLRFDSSTLQKTG